MFFLWNFPIAKQFSEIILMFMLFLDSGCDSVADAKMEDAGSLQASYSFPGCQAYEPLVTRLENLVAVQPDRIRCGVQYILLLQR